MKTQSSRDKFPSLVVLYGSLAMGVFSLAFTEGVCWFQ